MDFRETSSLTESKREAPREVEAAQLLVDLKQEEELSSQARAEANDNPGYGDRDKMNRDAQYNQAVDNRREAEIIADPEVQRVAEEYADKPKEIENELAATNGRMDEILKAEREAGGNRTEAQQQRLDELRQRKNGLIMAKNGGLGSAIESLKKKMQAQEGKGIQEEGREGKNLSSEEMALEKMKQDLPGLEGAFQNVKEPLYLSTIGGDNFTVVESPDSLNAGSVSADDLKRLGEYLNRLSQVEVAIRGKDDILENAAASRQREDNAREGKAGAVMQKMGVVLSELMNSDHNIHPQRLFTIIKAALDGAIRK
jgi:hypothetical protein